MKSYGMQANRYRDERVRRDRWIAASLLLGVAFWAAVCFWWVW